MGTGRLRHSKVLLSPSALSDQQRLLVKEEKIFKVTKFVGSEILERKQRC